MNSNQFKFRNIIVSIVTLRTFVNALFVFLNTPVLSQSLNNRASGLSWIIVLKDKNGKEHVMEKAHLSFKHTSVSIFWYGTGWPCLDVLSTLKLFGVIPLLPGQSAASSKNG